MTDVVSDILEESHVAKARPAIQGISPRDASALGGFRILGKDFKKDEPETRQEILDTMSPDVREAALILQGEQPSGPVSELTQSLVDAVNKWVESGGPVLGRGRKSSMVR